MSEREVSALELLNNYDNADNAVEDHSSSSENSFSSTDLETSTGRLDRQVASSTSIDFDPSNENCSNNLLGPTKAGVHTETPLNQQVSETHSSNPLSNSTMFNTSIKGDVGSWQLKRDYGSSILDGRGLSTEPELSLEEAEVLENNSQLPHHSFRDKRHSIRLTKAELDELPELAETVKSERLKEWASGFRRCDPRYRIMEYFDDAATLGMDYVSKKGSVESKLLSPILRMFAKSSCFTVWRPTSSDAIRKMILGEGVGKGLDIKGKSSKTGRLSGYVPFLQIHKEAHKDQILTLPKDSSISIFFSSADSRDDVAENVALVGEEMLAGFYQSQQEMETKTLTANNTSDVTNKLLWEMSDPEIVILDEYADAEKPAFGLEIPERLFWEAFVVRRDISRDADSKHATGRPSQPAFQDMNFASLRATPSGPDEPRPVLFQYSKEDPMEVRDLIVAYEENGRVVPVVSDFDCFLVGTRQTSYTLPIPDDQINLVHKCLSKVEKILREGQTTCSWTEKWLATLKQESEALKMPRYGYGDPKSISLIAMAVKRLARDGSVRHGAECFNYTFPQELDERFLVIGQDIGGSTPWKYVDRKGLQEILMAKVLEGFTFPLHPKWILCDPGWKEVYDALQSSTATHVQSSLDVWYPPESGIRERIEEIYQAYPNGFVRYRDSFNSNSLSYESRKSSLVSLENNGENEGTAAMDLAQHELQLNDSTALVNSAKSKIRAAMVFISMLKENRGSIDSSLDATEEEFIPGPPTLTIRTSDCCIPSEIEVVKKLSLRPCLKEKKSIVTPGIESGHGRPSMNKHNNNSFKWTGKKLKPSKRSTMLPIDLALSALEAGMLSGDSSTAEDEVCNSEDESRKKTDRTLVIKSLQEPQEQQRRRSSSLPAETFKDLLYDTSEEGEKVKRSTSLSELRTKGYMELQQLPPPDDPVKALRQEMISKWFPVERLVGFLDNDVVTSHDFHDVLVDLNLTPENVSPKKIFRFLDKEGIGEISTNVVLESLRPRADDVLAKNRPVDGTTTSLRQPPLLIGLVANTQMKMSMMKFLQDHIAFFRRVKFVSNKSVARVLEDSLGLIVEQQVSNVASEAEISSLVSQGKICAIFSLTDQMETFNRLCCMHNVLYANNAATAYAVVSMLESSHFEHHNYGTSFDEKYLTNDALKEISFPSDKLETAKVRKNIIPLDEQPPVALSSFATSDITEQTYTTHSKNNKKTFTRVISRLKPLSRRLSSIMNRRKKENNIDNPSKE